MADAYSTSTPDGVTTKYCSGCKNTLPAELFHKNRSTRDGLQGLCKHCSKAARKRPNPESIERTRRNRSLAQECGVKPCSACEKKKPLTPEYWTKEARGLGGFTSKCKECQRSSYWGKKGLAAIAKRQEAERFKSDGVKRCPSCSEVKSLDRFIKRKNGNGVYSSCLDCLREQSNKRRLSDIDADRQKKLRSWRKRKAENGDAMNARRNARRNSKRLTDPVFAMENRVRKLLSACLKRKGYTKRSKSHQILGCSWVEFAAHIEKQFTGGMGWERMGEIHIDHIVPIASAKTEDDVIALSHFTNLRPMWAKDNIAKGSERHYLV